MSQLILSPLVKKVAPIMQLALGESPGEATRLARNWYRVRAESRMRWKSIATASMEDTIAQTRAFYISDLSALIAYLSMQNQGIVLSTIHMGDYIQSLLAVLSKLSNRNIFLVRRKTPDEISSRVFAKLTGFKANYEVIYIAEPTAGLKVLRNLKRGAVLVMPYDLSSRFGSTSCFSLFEQKVNWVRGPVYYAAMANALLVPFITFRDDTGKKICELQPVISFDDSSPEQIQLTSQALVSLAERYIRSFPEQWLHWHLMPEMVADVE